MEPELRMSCNISEELRASIFITGDCYITAISGTSPYKFEALICINMM